MLPFGNMKPFRCSSFLLIPQFVSLCSLSIARDTITPNQPLLDNETLISSDGRFALGFFTPTNSHNRYIGVWYNKITVQTIVWVANRNNPTTNSTGTLSIDNKGSLVITHDQSSTTVWSISTTGLTNPVAQLLYTGNFVVRDGSASANTGSFAWQGFDYPTDTFITEMKIGVDLKTGLNRKLTAWKSDSDPSSGDTYLEMGITGDPEMYLWSGSTKVWRSGPWDGTGFSGILDSIVNAGVNLSFINNEQEVTYSYHQRNQTFSRLVVYSSGLVRRSVWIEETKQWNFFWYAPNDQCDDINQCGPFGLCNPNESPICSCLQGFTPKNPAEWALRVSSDGCTRNIALDCRTDGFVIVNNSKLPETTKTALKMSLNLGDCRALCLSNCSCTAYASANASDRSGCVIWVGELNDTRQYASANAGQDLYIRLAASEIGPTLGQSHKSRNTTTVAITVTLVVVGLLLACLGCCLWRRKIIKWGVIAYFFNDHNSHNGDSREDDIELPLFDLATIAAATDNFSIANILGEGGFGPVYKGKVGGEEQEIAVKTLAKTSIQGIEEFKNEVKLIAKLQHRNLVRLVGCCIQGEAKMLIYEYMPNKSLDAFLFEKEKAAQLDWQTRYNIILGIARGLLYLHQDSRFRIIHRDLKTSNILLDKDMNPKISDFGMARIFGGDETEVNTRRVVGTYGYMAPEYAMDGIFSVKSDVFSFGVLVLEIISGKKSRGVYASSPDLNLVTHAWNLWNEGNGLQMVDEMMKNSFPLMEVLKCLKVGLLCMQERPEYRPLMSEVILMLCGDGASLPPPRKPGFIVGRDLFDGGSSSDMSKWQL